MMEVPSRIVTQQLAKVLGIANRKENGRLIAGFNQP